MTATEKIIIPRNEDNIDDLLEKQDTYISMDDEVYGNLIYKKTFEDAVEENIICDYRLVVVKSGSSVSVVEDVLQNLCINKMLTYHRYCKDAKDFCDSLNKIGITAFYMDGTFSQKQCELLLDQFKDSDRAVLCSAKVLQEGISLPYVDSVYFVDPKSSEIDIVQSVGRALRLYPGKTIATLILHCDGDSSQVAVKYGGILKTLITLSPSIKKKGFNRKILGLGYSLDDKEFDTMKTKVNYVVYDRYDISWYEQYLFHLEFAKKADKSKGKVDFKTLQGKGMWFKNQKCKYRAQIRGNRYGNSRLLTSEQLEKIKELMILCGEDLTVITKRTWNDNYSFCINYQGKIVRSTVILDSNGNKVNIGKWIDTQKTSFKKSYGIGTSNRTSLTLERYNMLCKIPLWVEWVEEFYNDNPTLPRFESLNPKVIGS